MKRIIIAFAIVFLFVSVAMAPAPRPTRSPSRSREEGRCDRCPEGKDKWEIATTKDTKIKGDPKVGSKVTIEYTMTARASM